MSLKHKLPIPKRSAETIYEITPEFLREQGIKLLLMDLDNTLSPYIVDDAAEELKQWIETLKAGGSSPLSFPIIRVTVLCCLQSSLDWSM